jgi:hypothetical protein
MPTIRLTNQRTHSGLTEQVAISKTLKNYIDSPHIMNGYLRKCGKYTTRMFHHDTRKTHEPCLVGDALHDYAKVTACFPVSFSVIRTIFLEISMLSPTLLGLNAGVSAEIEFSAALRKRSILDKSNPESKIALKALTQTRNFSAKQLSSRGQIRSRFVSWKRRYDE